MIFAILQNRLYFSPFFIFMKFCFEISMHLQKVSKIVPRGPMCSLPSFPSKAVSYIIIVGHQTRFLYWYMWLCVYSSMPFDHICRSVLLPLLSRCGCTLCHIPVDLPRAVPWNHTNSLLTPLWQSVLHPYNSVILKILEKREHLMLHDLL